MLPSVVVAGVDPRGLLLEAPLLQRECSEVRAGSSLPGLLDAIVACRPKLVVLGTGVPDLAVPEAVRRIRGLSSTREVSILVLLPRQEAPSLDRTCRDAGANLVLRRPVDRYVLEAGVSRLLHVARRLDTRIKVEAQVVATARGEAPSHFCGTARNLSQNGLLLASPVGLSLGEDLDLELELPGARRLAALGRVVRQAPEIAWPFQGFGVEFLFLSPRATLALQALVASGLRADLTSDRVIASTVRRGVWVYEIWEPARGEGGWQVEIRRASRDNWRPGESGPFYVVDGASREAALSEARHFVLRQN